MREKDFLTREVYIRDLHKHREILDAIIEGDDKKASSVSVVKAVMKIAQKLCKKQEILGNYNDLQA